VFLRGNISTDDYARELFKPSENSTSHRICNEKKFLFGYQFFVSDIISGVVSRLFGPLTPKLLEVSISLKFLLEIEMSI